MVYCTDSYAEVIKNITENINNRAAQFCCGFPGETEEDFEETLDLVRRVGYDSAFTFLYSIRTGTPAAKADNQIPEDIKHERFNRLVEIVNESSAYKNSCYRGKVKEVLVDGISRSKEGVYEGRTDEFKLVNFKGSPEITGRIVPVKITDSNTFSLLGEIE